MTNSISDIHVNCLHEDVSKHIANKNSFDYKCEIKNHDYISQKIYNILIELQQYVVKYKVNTNQTKDDECNVNQNQNESKFKKIFNTICVYIKKILSIVIQFIRKIINFITSKFKKQPIIYSELLKSKVKNCLKEISNEIIKELNLTKSSDLEINKVCESIYSFFISQVSSNNVDKIYKDIVGDSVKKYIDRILQLESNTKTIFIEEYCDEIDDQNSSSSTTHDSDDDIRNQYIDLKRSNSIDSIKKPNLVRNIANKLKNKVKLGTNKTPKGIKRNKFRKT